MFTHHEHSAPKGADVTFVRGPVAEFVEDLRAGAGRQNVWIVGGGVLAAQFADAGALDEIIISIIPVVLGSGKAVLPHDGPDGAAGVALLARHGPGHRGAALPVRGHPGLVPARFALPARRRAYAPMSRIRLVMRAVDSRRPCSSVMTTSCVVSVRPRWIAVQVPVTVPAVMAR